MVSKRWKKTYAKRNIDLNLARKAQTPSPRVSKAGFWSCESKNKARRSKTRKRRCPRPVLHTHTPHTHMHPPLQIEKKMTCWVASLWCYIHCAVVSSKTAQVVMTCRRKKETEMWNRDTFIYRLRKLLSCRNVISLVALACVKRYVYWS